MTTKHCGACNKYVDTTTPHVHDPKRCPDCRETLPAAMFARHPSAADGRRGQCMKCVEKKSVETKARKAIQRDEHRKSRNARFALHGYRWVLRPPHIEGPKWMLVDVAGQEVTPDEAEARIDQKRQDSSFDDWE